MTDRGTFVINGAERVILTKLLEVQEYITNQRPINKEEELIVAA